MKITKFWKRTLIGGAAALTLAAGLSMTTGVETAYAQDTPATPEPSAWQGRWGGRGHDGMHGGLFGPFGGGRDGTRQERLAEALGITADELEAAHDAVHEAAIQEALANGDITQEQVDLMEAHRAVRDYIDREAIMVEVLGVSMDELEAARDDGTLRDLLSNLNLDRGEMGEQMKAAMDAALNQAVGDGVITQEQADQLHAQGGQLGLGHKDFGKRGFDGERFGGEGRGERGPRGFFNQNDG